MALTLNRRFFPGKDQAWLEARLAEVLDELANGKTIDAWAAGDSNAHKALDKNLGPERRRDMLLNDLSIIAPATYPPADVIAIKRTITRYLACLLLLVAFAASGCSAMRTFQQDADGRITRTSALTFFDGRSELARMTTSNTDKTQSVRVSGLNQETSGTNTVELIDRVIRAAVSAAAAAAK